MPLSENALRNGILLLLVAAFVSLGAGAGEVSWSPCTAMPTAYSLQTNTSLVTIANASISLFPIYEGAPMYEMNVTFSFLGLQEWWNYNDSSDGCYESSGAVPYGVNITGHTPYNALMFADMECMVTYVEDVIPGTEINLETYVVQARHPNFSSTTITVNVTKSLGDTTFTYSGSTDTSNLPIYVRYNSSSIKVSLEVTGWDWQGPEDSYLNAMLSGFANLAYPSQVFFGQIDNPANASYFSCQTISGPPVSLNLEIDHGFFLQNYTTEPTQKPVMNVLPHQHLQATWQPSYGPFGSAFGFAFCHFNATGHFDRLTWDPQLFSSIFGDANPTPSQTPVPLWIIGPIVGGTVLIVAVVSIAYAIHQKKLWKDRHSTRHTM